MWTEQKGADDTEAQLLKEQYKVGMVLIGLALIREWENNSELRERVGESFDLEKLIQEVSAAVSPMLLPMIVSLGELSLEEATHLRVEEA